MGIIHNLGTVPCMLFCEIILLEFSNVSSAILASQKFCCCADQPSALQDELDYFAQLLGRGLQLTGLVVPLHCGPCVMLDFVLLLCSRAGWSVWPG
jgi:hypothetical protein